MSDIQFSVGKIYKNQKRSSLFESIKTPIVTKKQIQTTHKNDAIKLLRIASGMHANREHLMRRRQKALGVWF